MILNWIRRKKQARGHDVHSPFAYQLITDVIHEKHEYNVFSDIEETLPDYYIETSHQQLHHLSYRLVKHFKPQNVLEIESGKGINTLYICAADENIRCRCFEENKQESIIAENLIIGNKNKNIRLIDEIDDSDKYDAIFVYLNTFPIDIEILLSMSTNNTFWVLTGIESGNGKRFWKRIVKDKRVRVTFNLKDIGIAVLNESYHKENYLV